MGEGPLLDVFIGDPSGGDVLDPTALARLFGLTPAEARLAVALHAGRSPREHAADRGVRVSTVRSHLKQLFLKLDVRRQADLIRLLDRLPPTFRDR